MKFVLICIQAVLLVACNSSIDYDKIPTFDQDGYVNAIIEIPAGTNKKFEYDHSNHAFVQDVKNGKKRSIHFLPYLGNYGYIPNTLSDNSQGGDGDPLDVLVLSESAETGDVLKVVIIGGIGLIDEGEIDTKLIAVPVDVEKRILDYVDIKELNKNHPVVVKMICEWFVNYDKNEKTFVKSILTKQEAIKELEDSQGI